MVINMKYKHIIFGVSSLLIIIGTITNPKKEDHLNFIFYNAINKEKLANANELELISLQLIKNSFEEIVSTDNYVVFSIGKVNFHGVTKKASIGFLGNVYPILNTQELQEILGEEKNEESSIEKKSKKRATANLEISNPKQEVKNKIGDKIYGDFNGDHSFEYAYRVLAKKGKGNPVEDGIPDQYEIQFSDKTIKSIPVGCCWFKLINEGDLDRDGTDEITIVQAPENGCTGWVNTFTIKNNQYRSFIEPFSIYWCAELPDNQLQNLVVNENNIIYYYEADPNDDDLLNKNDGKIRFERLKKIKALKLNL